MAKTQVKRPDTPLAITPEPIKIGRLKEVRDSLSNSAERKVNYGETMVKRYPELNKESDSAIRSGMKDYNDSKRYNEIINKATKKK